ncbi:SIMPL domain-containing protein [Zoogloea sp.]|uniref:SIMPL domain-containing protein n=1 Tax=Zoogloea sp. TaxID=49181 RepID=UPI0035AFB669
MKLRPLRPLALALPLAFVAAAANAADAPPLPTADIAVESSRSAPNDQFRAQVFAEATDSSPAELARKVNATVAHALQLARAYPAVKVQTAGNSTYPIYAKTGRSIEAWRMRSTLALESKDASQLSELVGKLQQSMAIGGLSAAPSPETWKKIEDEAIADALAAFEARARLVAGSLHKKWRIKHVSVNTGGYQPRQPAAPMVRSAMAMAEAAPPAPIEGGDSPVAVSVNGQIELLE